MSSNIKSISPLLLPSIHPLLSASAKHRPTIINYLLLAPFRTRFNVKSGVLHSGVFNIFDIKLISPYKIKELVKSLRSRVVYKFSCGGCVPVMWERLSNRHLATRTREHLSTDKSYQISYPLREVETTMLEQDPQNPKIDGGLCLQPPSSCLFCIATPLSSSKK